MVQIYAFENIVSGLAYIGCTKGKLNKRAREHRCLLRAGRHTDRNLQREWNSCGGQGFEMRLLEEVGVDVRVEAELRWMKAFKVAGSLLNQHEISFRPPPGAAAKAVAARAANGYRPSAASNEKRRAAQLGIPKGHGAKISAAKRAKAMKR